MEFLHMIFVGPFLDMVALPDLFLQALWEGFVGGTLYALLALGFVLIFKASGVFNFAQPVLMVLAALSLVSFYEMGVHPWISVLLVLVLMYCLAFGIPESCPTVRLGCNAAAPRGTCALRSPHSRWGKNKRR